MDIKLVLAYCAPAKLLEVAGEPLHRTALGVADRVVAARVTFTPGRNHGTDAAAGQRSHEQVGVVGAAATPQAGAKSCSRGRAWRGVVALARHRAPLRASQSTLSQSGVYRARHLCPPGPVAAAPNAPRGPG